MTRLVPQLAVLQARHSDMNFDTFNRRGEDAFLKFGDEAGWTGAWFSRVTIKATRAGVQCGSITLKETVKRWLLMIYNLLNTKSYLFS